MAVDSSFNMSKKDNISKPDYQSDGSEAEKEVSTRSPSPSSSSDESGSSSSSTISSPSLGPLPDAVDLFFSSVSLGGFPQPSEKVQPWRRVWKGPQEPSPDGKLLVACPKICVYGSNNLGGY